MVNDPQSDSYKTILSYSQGQIKDQTKANTKNNSSADRTRDDEGILT
jgi:hypothetical protein